MRAHSKIIVHIYWSLKIFLYCRFELIRVICDFNTRQKQHRLILLYIHSVINLRYTKKWFCFLRMFNIYLYWNTPINFLNSYKLVLLDILYHSSTVALFYRLSLHFLILSSSSEANLWHIIGLQNRLLSRRDSFRCRSCIKIFFPQRLLNLSPRSKDYFWVFFIWV